MKLRIGIIGLGVGEAHIQGYAKSCFAEVVALCDFNPQCLAEAKRKYPGMRFFEDADDLLRAPDIDVVSVASYDNYHHRQIMLAVEHGKHVFAEKPLCQHDFEVRDIRKALRKNKGIKISSNLILRKCPRFIELKNRIVSGKMGELFHMDGSYDYGRRHKILDGWRGKIDCFSGISGGGVHIIDLFLWFSGKKVREVMAYGNKIVTRFSEFRYNDSVTAILQFENGLTAKVSVHLGAVMPHHHGLNIYGEKATFLNNYGHPLYFSSQDPQCKPEVMSQEYPGVQKGDLIADFIESIVNNTEPEVGAEEIFGAMSVCFAVNKSLECGRPVKVKYI